MEHLEDALRRYRPCGPPAELRGRVLHIEPVGRPFQGRRWREWSLPLVAAVIALAFYMLGSRVQRELRDEDVDAAVRQAAIAAITAALDGDDLTRHEAEWIVRRAEVVDPVPRSALELFDEQRPIP